MCTHLLFSPTWENVGPVLNRWARLSPSVRSLAHPKMGGILVLLMANLRQIRLRKFNWPNSTQCVTKAEWGFRFLDWMFFMGWLLLNSNKQICLDESSSFVIPSHPAWQAWSLMNLPSKAKTALEKALSLFPPFSWQKQSLEYQWSMRACISLSYRCSFYHLYVCMTWVSLRIRYISTFLYWRKVFSDFYTFGIIAKEQHADSRTV